MADDRFEIHAGGWGSFDEADDYRHEANRLLTLARQESSRADALQHRVTRLEVIMYKAKELIYNPAGVQNLKVLEELQVLVDKYSPPKIIKRSLFDD